MSTIYTKGSECVQKSENRLFGTAAMMVAVTLLAKVFGMLRDILTASHFGTTEAAVAYEAASRLPITLFDFALGGVVTAAFIPIFNEILAKRGRRTAGKAACRLSRAGDQRIGKGTCRAALPHDVPDDYFHRSGLLLRRYSAIL